MTQLRNIKAIPKLSRLSNSECRERAVYSKYFVYTNYFMSKG